MVEELTVAAKEEEEETRITERELVKRGRRSMRTRRGCGGRSFTTS